MSSKCRLLVVAGLGLMGTMSLNVLERTREIGVLRCIGASDGQIRSIVIAEGLIIGVISWAVGTLLAVPISRSLSNSVGDSLFHTPLDYTFPLSAPLVWLAGVLVLAGTASFIPAWNASRMPVRDVLAYE